MKVFTKTVRSVAFVTLTISAVAYAASGIVTTSLSAGSDRANAGTILPSGDLISAGYANNSAFAFSRHSSAGSLLASGTASFSNPSKAYAVVAQPSGKIVLGGTNLSSKQGKNGLYPGAFSLARFNQNGSLDTTFGSKGKVETSFGSGAATIEDMVLAPDAAIIAVGTTNATGKGDVVALARYTANGSLIWKTTTDLGISADAGGAVALQGSKILVAGTASKAMYGAENDFALIRYDGNGALDTTFGTGGIVTTQLGSTNDRAFAIVQQSDGKIILVGKFYNPLTSNNDVAMVRYSSEGVIDTTFGTAGTGIVTTDLGVDDWARAAAIQPDGKIVVAGYSQMAAGGGDIIVLRYNTDGTLDTSFNGVGYRFTTLSQQALGEGVTLQSDGKIVVFGSVNASGGADFVMVRYNADGTVDTSF